MLWFPRQNAPVFVRCRHMTTIFTIGHGNRPIGEMISLLAEARIECLTDVRAYPASRRHPQFMRAALEQSLAEAGIRYMWEGKTLGGRRRPAKNSPHVALRNESFRAYADHMATPEFRTALDALVDLSGTTRTAIMCAERLPWQCHRFLISDSLTVQGVPVTHLIARGNSRPHVLNPVARATAGGLVYDVTGQFGLDLGGKGNTD
jgi:uncharacterized protein (DUF488 family)